MKFIKLTCRNGHPVVIPVDKITGFCVDGIDPNYSWVQTGPSGPDGSENGWPVMESLEDIEALMMGGE